MSRAELLRAPVMLGAGGIGALGLLHLRDPHASGSYGFCPFLLVTGEPCPGCGGLRAMNDLTHGDVVGALSSNAMAVVLLVVMSAAWLVWALVIGFGIFGVLRWTPWGVWLRP